MKPLTFYLRPLISLFMVLIGCTKVQLMNHVPQDEKYHSNILMWHVCILLYYFNLFLGACLYLMNRASGRDRACSNHLLKQK